MESKLCSQRAAIVFYLTGINIRWRVDTVYLCIEFICNLLILWVIYLPAFRLWLHLHRSPHLRSSSCCLSLSFSLTFIPESKHFTELISFSHRTNILVHATSNKWLGENQLVYKKETLLDNTQTCCPAANSNLLIMAENISSLCTFLGLAPLQLLN